MLKSNISVGAVGVLLIGASLSNHFIRSSTRVINCIAPSWIGAYSVAIRSVVSYCRNKNVKIYCLQNIKLFNTIIIVIFFFNGTHWQNKTLNFLSRLLDLVN